MIWLCLAAAAGHYYFRELTGDGFQPAVSPGVPKEFEYVLDDAVHFMGVELEALGVDAVAREAALGRMREGVKDRTIARLNESESAR